MGRPWIYRNFARAWDKVVRRADYRLARKMFSEGRTKDEIRGHLIGDQDLQRRDLRRTAMTRMAEVGATIAQIAAVSGHSIEQTQRILSRYILPNGAAAAKAIGLWKRMSVSLNLWRQSRETEGSVPPVRCGPVRLRGIVRLPTA